MYTVEFYEKANGESERWNFLEELREKSATNKMPAYNINR